MVSMAGANKNGFKRVKNIGIVVNQNKKKCPARTERFKKVAEGKGVSNL